MTSDVEQVFDGDIAIGPRVTELAVQPQFATAAMIFRVVDADGQNAAGAIVTFAGRIEVVSSTGFAVFPDTPLGVHPWLVTFAGHVSQSGTFQVVADEGLFTNAIRVDLVRVGVLTGTIIIQTHEGNVFGPAVRDVIITVGGQAVEANPAGVAEVDLPPGTYSAVATKSGYEPGGFDGYGDPETHTWVWGATAVPVVARRTTTAAVVLQRVGVDVGTVIVHVADPLGVAIAGAAVTLNSFSRDTDPFGVATFEDVPATPEQHRVAATHPDFELAPALQQVNVVAGEETHVFITLTPIGVFTEVTVSVVDAVTGAPVVGARVFFAGFPDRSIREVPTNEQGVVVFDEIPVGQALVIAVVATCYGTFDQTGLVFDRDPEALTVSLVPIEDCEPGPPGGGGANAALLLGGLAAGAFVLFAFGRGRGREPAPAAREEV